jgi:hypothetical protein
VPYRVLKGLLVDAAAIVRAYPPMIVAFATVLAGAALVFDLIYLTAALPPGLIAIAMVPLLAGLVACLIAADDLGLSRRAVVRTVGAAGMLLLTNVAAVAMIAAIRGPSGWKAVLQTIGLAILTAGCVGGSAVVLSGLARSLGITLVTQLPPRKPKPPKPAPVALRVRTEPAAEKPAKVDPPPAEPEELAASAPRLVNLTDARPVGLPDYVPGHPDARVPRRSVPPARPQRRRPPGYRG